MIFGKRAEQGLKYARIRAKINEFSVDVNQAPVFPFDSDDLCFESILTISDASAELLAGDVLTTEARRDLSYTASFLDAAANEKRHHQSRDLFLTLACISFFLLGNYGSSKSALSRIDRRNAFGENASRCLLMVDYLLNGEKDRSFPFPLLASYVDGKSNNPDAVIAEAARCAANSDATEDFFGDTVRACVLVALRDAAAKLLPQYSDIPLASWKTAMQSQEFEKLLWQAQQRVGEGGAFAGSDLFVQLPTGSGKTKSIELLIRSRVVAGCCHRAVVVAPLKALCSEIAKDLRDSLSDIVCVRHSTDVFEVDEWLGVDEPKPEVLVFTPEKLSFILHHSNLEIESVDLFIFDESHLIDNMSRGPSYELLLAEIIAERKDAQLILISAVTSNSDKVSEWAFSDPSRRTKSEGIESTEKTIGFFSQKKGRIDFFQYGGSADLNYFLPYRIPVRALSARQNRDKTTSFPDLTASAKRQRSGDLALFYSMQLAHGGPIAIYIPKSSNVWAFHNRIAELLSFGLDFSQIISTGDPGELCKFAHLFSLHYGERCVFSESALSGILPHFRGLQGVLKQAVEYAMRSGAVRCISCTSTLAQGVNLPLRYILITDKFNGFERATVREFQNLIGRTARAGKYSEGSIIVCDSDLEKPGTRKDYELLFDANSVEDCESAILSLFKDVSIRVRNSESKIKGEVVANYILEHFGDVNLETNLIDNLALTLKCDPEKVRKEASAKIISLEAVENYVASNMVTVSGDYSPDVRAICAGTYAYYCMDDYRRSLLVNLFETIYKYFEEQGTNQRAVVAKTQAGVRKAAALSAWVETEECSSFLKSGCKDLALIANAFCRIARPNFPKWLTVEVFSDVSRLWIEGANIETILKRIKDECKSSSRSCPSQESIGKLTSEIVSYDFSHFVSQVNDAISVLLETRQYEEDLLGLQKRLKYGVNRREEMLLCEELFNDRLVVRQILISMGSPLANEGTTLKLYARKHRAQIEGLLKSYPSYLQNRFRLWLS